ncbi:hypothetical protein [Paenibacillus sp. 481]|uniref:hypothetical protein n=1 Tax=Paenibacillus sp. 481 TaxID=2835869 RepID=UPI001E307402|nr:hypothetical protein [Paenibacillus sp. 481]UHA73152.1 DUF4214 domain-containing protein [Paenibacillus sp. 481]
MRIIQLLCAAMLLPDTEFVKTISVQLRNREPYEDEMTHYLSSLSSGVSRIDYIVDIVLSMESRVVYDSPYVHGEEPTVANIFRNTITYFPEQLVHTLFRELLCREPEQEEFILYEHAVANGLSPVEMFAYMVQSAECKSLLESGHSNPVAERLKLYYVG